jgi:hypothetical protein
LRYRQYFPFFYFVIAFSQRDQYVGSFRGHRSRDSVFDELFPTGYDHLFAF